MHSAWARISARHCVHVLCVYIVCISVPLWNVVYVGKDRLVYSLTVKIIDAFGPIELYNSSREAPFCVFTSEQWW